MNALEDIQKHLLPGEAIEATVVGELYMAEQPQIQEVLHGADALEALGNAPSFYGGVLNGVRPVYVWTNIRVIFAVDYDGSTYLTSVPRFPGASTPRFVG